MINKIVIFLVAILIIIGGAYLLFQRSTIDKETPLLLNVPIMILTSPHFEHNQSIPAQYTCDGENVNPALQISKVPTEAQSLVLIMDDPDAPSGTWVHWTIWNIDPKTTEIAEASVPQGAQEGLTSFGQPGYGGPCPPSGTHRYFFKVYALDSRLELASTSNKDDLEKALAGHIIASAELLGLYRRE